MRLYNNLVGPHTHTHRTLLDPCVTRRLHVNTCTHGGWCLLARCSSFCFFFLLLQTFLASAITANFWGADPQLKHHCWGETELLCCVRRAPPALIRTIQDQESVYTHTHTLPNNCVGKAEDAAAFCVTYTRLPALRQNKLWLHSTRYRVLPVKIKLGYTNPE